MRQVLFLLLLLGVGCAQSIDVPEEPPLAPNFLRLQSWSAVSADGLAADGFVRWVYLADDPSTTPKPREYCEIWEQLELDRIDSAVCPGCTDVWEGTATVEVDQGTCLDVDWSSRSFGLGFGQLADAPDDVSGLGEDGSFLGFDPGQDLGSATDASTSVVLGDIDGKIADSSVRRSITQHKMDGEAFSLTLRRAAEESKTTSAPSPASSMFKYYGTEQNKTRFEIILSLMGSQSLGWEGEGFDDRELSATREWLRSKANSIEGGTSEVQLNIIAKRVLGLPD